MMLLVALLSALTQPTPIEGPEHLAGFFEALRAREGAEPLGRVRVTVFGDSHTAADLWTSTIRQGLQARFGDGGRGLVLAGKAWRSYWQDDVKLGAEGAWTNHGLRKGLDDGFFGVGGCSMASADPAASLVVGTGKGGRADAAEIHYLRQPTGGCFEVWVDGVRVRSISARGPWTEVAFAHFDLPVGAHTLKIRPMLGGESRLLGVSLTLGDGVVLDALGSNGAQAKRLLRMDPLAFSTGLARLAPNLLVFSYGANEAFNDRLVPADYAKRLTEVVERARAAVPSAECLLMGPPDLRVRGEYPAHLDDIIAVQRGLAERLGCGFWDSQAAMGGPGAMRRWRRKKLGRSDNVHLTRAGYEAIGQGLLDALLDAYEADTQQR